MSNTVELIKSLEKEIQFSGVLNIFLVLFGIKKVCRIEEIQNLERVEQVLSTFNIPFYLHQNKKLYLAKNKDDLNQALLTDIKKHDAYTFGRLLGFPDCCIENFTRVLGIADRRLFQELGKLQYREKSSHYLNFFEHKLIYHIPCSMNCEASISLGKKTFALYKKLIGTRPPDFFLQKTYILFSNLQWVKIQEGKYTFGGLLKPVNSRSIAKIKKGYTVTITSDDEVTLSSPDGSERVREKVALFQFI